MSAIRIVRDSLKSRIVREGISERIVDIFTSLNDEEQEGGIAGAIQTIGGFLVRPLGWLKNLLSGFVSAIARRLRRWLLRNLWEIFLTLTFEIAYFNWTQTDAQIEAQIRANELQVIAQLGELVGVGAVWLASISLAGIATLKWPVISGQILLDLIEEGSDEVKGEVRSLLSQLRNSLTRNAVLASILAARRMHVFGLEPIIEAREPWTIAGEIEEKIESIEDDRLRTFVENMVEGSVDALIEVGYVISYTIEDYYRSQELAQRAVIGEKRGVEIQFDERIEDEKMIVTGPQELTQQSVENALSTYRLVYGRDIGQFVGQPLNDYVRGGVQRRKLTIVFKSKEKPPWTPRVGDEPIKELSYTIPEVEVGLTWREIKTAARHWQWGRFRCTANLEKGRQMSVYGASAQEAEDKLRELHQLCTLEILTLSVTEEGDRHLNLRKRATQMYPAYATLVVRRPTNGANGIPDLKGQKYSSESIRIDLWPENEPPNLEPLS